MQESDFFIDNNIAFITLNDIQNKNALNYTILKQLKNHLENAINIKSRVIILRAKGEFFCNGMDFNFLIENAKEISLISESINLYSDLLKQIYLSPIPVICIVTGSVKAGGIGLIGATDIIIASEKSDFELTEIIFGLVPFNVIPFIYSNRISPQKTKYLILTAKKLSAIDAKNIGLIDEVYPENELEKNIKNLIKSIFRASPEAIKIAKNFLHTLYNISFDKAINNAKENLIELLKDQKVIENIKKFRDGEIPDWFLKLKSEKPFVI